MNSKSERITMFIAIFIGFASVLATTNVYAQAPATLQKSPLPQGTKMMSMGGNSMKGPWSGGNGNGMSEDNLTSSVSIFQPIINAFKSSIHVSLNDAISTAQQSVGANSSAIAAFIHPERQFIVYNVFTIDPNGSIHKVLVDPGNGKVLSNEQISFMEMMMMVHGGGGGQGYNGMMGPGMGMMDHGGWNGPGMGMMDHGGWNGPGMGMMDHGGWNGPGMGMMDHGGWNGPGMGMMDH
jgi:hypothetical protein